MPLNHKLIKILMTRIFILLIGLFIGVHRIDLLEYQGSFMLTPILLFSGSFSLYYIVRSIVLGARRPDNFFALIFLLFLFLLWSFINLDFEDLTQIKRFCLFLYLIFNALILNIAIFNQPEPRKTINSFLNLCLISYGLFSVLQSYYFFNNQVHISGQQDFRWVELYPFSMGVYYARITGGFLDPNIAGYFLIFIYLVKSSIKNTNSSKAFNFFIYVFIFITFSRTAITTYLLVLAFEYLYFNYVSIVKYFKKGNLLITSLTLAVFITAVFYLISTGKYEVFLEKRLTTNDKSAQIHFALLKHGFETATDNLEHFISGHGFGSSYIYTSVFFGGSKYGNFHSEFLTSVVETGIVGLSLYLVIIFGSTLAIKNIRLSKHSFYLMLIPVVIFLEGILYQQFLFQHYWFFLFIPWFWTDKNFFSQIEEETNLL